ncbi:D-arabinono-1,4-lactone oxidase [Micromonospora sp. WMMD1082]|uniref:D-arabinono-1,4-lactone oxidase n=1 Tax=Micromonospora sp. WMMD1082 TaxID=3016104 RepID=UPI00241704F5|nr:D-arabinono-1,4-lactone oxidase [Micromonospora sp. WMMD1082]MDG4795367.1 D-arabinono-1,4-lactone oxidase [Micromonospora sp. WMMD1082]
MVAGTAAEAAGWSNWAGNQHSVATAVLRPSSVDEAADQVRRAVEAGERIRPVGSGHSFTPVAVADGQRMDLTRLAIDVRVDVDRRLVTVPAGMTLRELNALLAGHRLALPNLGDIDAQTVAGAISTGTHGTGAAHGGLATFVEALTLVTGAGEVLRCSAEKHPDVFDAARVSLGALGVLVEVTLRCVDAFVLRAHERPASLDSVLAELPGLVDAHDHVEFFWFPGTSRVQLKTNDRVAVDDLPLPRWRGWLDDDFLANTVFAGACRLGRAVPALAPGISAFSARALGERRYTGRSDAVFCSPRRVRFLEMEYALPREALVDALDALRRIVHGLPFAVLFPVEVRFSAADGIWLSPAHGRESAYVAVHQYVGMPYEPYFRAFEEVAMGLGGRPHWGKLHWRDAGSLAPAYPRWHDFQALRTHLDPHHTLTTPYLSTLLG